MSLRSTARSRLAPVAPPVEEGQRDLGSERPGALARAEQVGQIGAGRSQEAGERDAREEGRARRTNIRAARAQPVLGRLDVRAVDEQFGRRAGRQVLQQQGYVGRLCRLCRPCGQVRPQILNARQQQQGVAGLAQFAFAALHVGAGLGGQAQGVLVIQGGGRARLAPLRSQAQRGFTALQRALRQLQAAQGPVAGTGRPAPLRHPG